MTISTRIFLAALFLGLSIPAFAQEARPSGPPDEVDQLGQMVGLSEEQKTDIRSIIGEMTPKLEELQDQAERVQQELQEQAGPDFEESKIRETAAKLGELTGEMTALTVILQSRVARVFTEEQRDQLEQMSQQQAQLQQQQMQQQMQRQVEEQLRQQQQQQQPPQQQEP
jgi:periplasmic protein CpxP/Spy